MLDRDYTAGGNQTAEGRRGGYILTRTAVICRALSAAIVGGRDDQNSTCLRVKGSTGGACWLDPARHARRNPGESVCGCWCQRQIPATSRKRRLCRGYCPAYAGRTVNSWGNLESLTSAIRSRGRKMENRIARASRNKNRPATVTVAFKRYKL